MNRVKQCPNCSTMLRFPVTQGTILVQCPVCSHRFTFDPEIEIEDSFNVSEVEIPSFQFKPTFQNYKDLIVDLLYAPIDYLKSKRGNRKNEIPWIPILLFSILLLYVWKWSNTEANMERDSHKDPIFQEEPQKDLQPFEVPPVDSEEEGLEPIEPKKPSIEI
ncbi:zinc-ribbon domain-containing protein [Leptospira levettii]|uniref:zinc-ribbon domain-containing protein n=2 Tax=Leptospira levettii TaxID=2023178 RepID=UPI001FAF8183|nr:zinc-ribbon domain-containing protein [Leptospira levettii]